MQHFSGVQNPGELVRIGFLVYLGAFGIDKEGVGLPDKVSVVSIDDDF